MPRAIQGGDGKPRPGPGQRTYRDGPTLGHGEPLQGFPRQAHGKGSPAFLYFGWIDMDIPRVHKMKGAAQGLGDGFLDRPEKRRGMGQVSAYQLHCLVKLPYVEDPVHGIAFLEFAFPATSMPISVSSPQRAAQTSSPSVLKEIPGPRVLPPGDGAGPAGRGPAEPGVRPGWRNGGVSKEDLPLPEGVPRGW